MLYLSMFISKGRKSHNGGVPFPLKNVKRWCRFSLQTRNLWANPHWDTWLPPTTTNSYCKLIDIDKKIHQIGKQEVDLQVWNWQVQFRTSSRGYTPKIKSIGFLEKYDENICFRRKDKAKSITTLQSGGIIKDFKKQKKKKIRFRVLIILLHFILFANILYL